MSESNSEFTNESQGSDADITDQNHRTASGDNQKGCRARNYPTFTYSRKDLFSRIVVGLIIGALFILGLGLIFPSLAKVTDGDMGNAQSRNNLRQMGTGMLNVASNTTTGNIPPAYGEFPHGAGNSASFFEHMLPFIFAAPHYGGFPAGLPIKTYIAPCDSRNPGTDDTISYCTNAMLLSGAPHHPASFNGRAASLICIMERSGLDGTHKWSNQNNSLGTPDTPPPFPQLGVPPALYLDGFPQSFSSQGCFVVLGDGSVRAIAKAQLYAWNWACAPQDRSPPPADW